VGEAVCASCHPREAALWRGSHHEQAMQPASAALARFDGSSFTHHGVTSTFFRRDGALVARTDGPDGALHDYPITYTLGVAPLQQYLVAFPGGRYQALEVAWDSTARRWFHLYPDERIGSGDELHWTGPAENWNFMCADCHSTNLRKRFDGVGYSTEFAEMPVSCEACHGPGSLHAAGQGLPIALDERRDVGWTRVDGKPHRSAPRTSAREIEMCARCHSRRGILHEDQVHGQPLGDDYHVALLDDDLYYPDGQIKGEVYEYGSFVQSRMFAEGVTCSDCHDPHRPELRTSGDSLCLKCHEEKSYFTTRHHFHVEGSPGARCVSCHMPATTYMGVDARRDHSLRVPRPDLSVKLGVPNACNRCHAERSASWAARTVEKWYGHTPSGHQRFAEALAAGSQGAPDATRLLLALAADRGQPAIARASAIQRMTRDWTELTFAAVRDALGDPDALVRRAAVDALAEVDPRVSAPLLEPLVEDEVRAVRIRAAAALASPSPPSPPLERATAELIAAQTLNADRPEAHLALARLATSRQRYAEAETELKRALAIDSGFVPAVVNLVDLYRAMERDAAGEPVLREALQRMPDQPALLHALGLLLVREKRLEEAGECLGAAARLAPQNPRFGYVYAVALYSAGRKAQAIGFLEQVIARHPFDRDSLSALQTFQREARRGRWSAVPNPRTESSR
jgi:predicted CXXCH cytochrome family protein